MKETTEVKDFFEDLLKAQLMRLPSQGPPKVSSNQGVYILYSVIGVVLHVGRSIRAKGGVNQRLNDHLKGKGSFTREYAYLSKIELREEVPFRFKEVHDDPKRALVEAFTCRSLCRVHLATGHKE